MSSTEVQDHYEVLGISSSATTEEIKKAYRRLARQHHPDHSGEEELFKQINFAYDVLSDVAKRNTYDLTRGMGSFSTASRSSFSDDFGYWGSSDFFRNGFGDQWGRSSFREERPEPPREVTFTVGDREYTAVYSPRDSFYGSNYYTLVIDLEEAEDFYENLRQTQLGFSLKMIVMDGTVEAFRCESYLFTYCFSDYRKGAARRKLQKEYEEVRTGFAVRFEKLVLKGVPTRSLENHLREFDKLRGEYFVSKHHGNGRLKALIATIEKELTRLESSDLVDVLVKGLMEGTVFHEDVLHNNVVWLALQSYSIRSGGFIEALTKEQLAAHYSTCLQGVVSARLLQRYSFRLRLEDFAPREILDDPELELAPESITLQGNKGDVTYPVTYTYKSQGATQVATAVISLPLRVYEKVAPEYGRKSGLPELPHGIRWYIHVVCDGKELAHGLDDALLAERVRKAVKARGRRKHADDMMATADRGEVPPWFKGANKPGRRR